MIKGFDIAQLVIDEIGLQALGEEPPDAKVVAQRVKKSPSAGPTSASCWRRARRILGWPAASLS
jgi:hypothetical protein